MTLQEIRRGPDGQRYRRPSWPQSRVIWLAPSYWLIRWESWRKASEPFGGGGGRSYRVESWTPEAEDWAADDFEATEDL